MKRKNGTTLNGESVEGLTREVAEVRAELTLAQQEIMRRKEAERRNLALILRLEEALAHVQKLERLLPVCSSCRRIRIETDGASLEARAEWVSLEEYICATTDFKMSHGLCAECTRQLYPEIADEVFEQVTHRHP